jgi:hypothetical protein
VESLEALKMMEIHIWPLLEREKEMVAPLITALEGFSF